MTRPPVSRCPVDQGGGCLRQLVVLGVHFVIGDFVHLYRTKSAQTHMERYKTDGYPHFPDPVQQLLRKMKSSGGRRCGTRFPRIDRLIPFFVFQFVRNIVWQGHLTDLLQQRIEVSFIAEPHQPVALVDDIQHIGLQLSAAEGQGCSGAGLLSRTRQHLPAVISLGVKQKKLHRPARYPFAVRRGGRAVHGCR